MLFRVTQTILNLFLLVLLILAAAILSSFVHLPGGYKSYVVLTGSMAPAIQPGSLIVVRAAGQYAVSDIITRSTSDPKVTVTHRIIEIVATGDGVQYRTKGDANGMADGDLVSNGEILGRTVWTLPRVGTIISYAKTKQGFLLMVLVPSVLVIIEEIMNIAVAVQKRRVVLNPKPRVLKIL